MTVRVVPDKLKEEIKTVPTHISIEQVTKRTKKRPKLTDLKGLRASPPTTTNKSYSFQFLSCHGGRGTCSETHQTTS